MTAPQKLVWRRPERLLTCYFLRPIKCAQGNIYCFELQGHLHSSRWLVDKRDKCLGCQGHMERKYPTTWQKEGVWVKYFALQGKQNFQYLAQTSGIPEGIIPSTIRELPPIQASSEQPRLLSQPPFSIFSERYRGWISWACRLNQLLSISTYIKQLEMTWDVSILKRYKWI